MMALHIGWLRPPNFRFCRRNFFLGGPRAPHSWLLFPIGWPLQYSCGIPWSQCAVIKKQPLKPEVAWIWEHLCNIPCSEMSVKQPSLSKVQSFFFMLPLADTSLLPFWARHAAQLQRLQCLWIHPSLWSGLQYLGSYIQLWSPKNEALWPGSPHTFPPWPLPVLEMPVPPLCSMLAEPTPDLADAYRNAVYLGLWWIGHITWYEEDRQE